MNLLITSTVLSCINPYAARYSVSGSLEFMQHLSALIHIESSNDPSATSSAGAVGLTQMTTVALTELKLAEDVPKECRPDPKLTINSLYSAKESVHYGSCYLRLMLERYGNNWTRALLAYNGGGSQVKRLDKRKLMSYESLSYVVKVFDWIERNCKKGL